MATPRLQHILESCYELNLTHFRMQYCVKSSLCGMDCSLYIHVFEQNALRAFQSFLSITSSFFHSVPSCVCLFAGLSFHTSFRLQCHCSLVALIGCCDGVGCPWVCPLTDQSLILTDGGLPRSHTGIRGARDHISGAAGRPP